MSVNVASPEGRSPLGNTNQESLELFIPIAESQLQKCGSRCIAEEDGYKRLILSELHRQQRKVSSLEPATRITRSSLNRILRGASRLTDELRHQCFEELEIDQHQAYVAIAMMGDPKAYNNPATHFIAQILRAVQEDVCYARQGRITEFFKPRLIKQAAKNGVDTFFAHIEQIEEKNRSFICDYA